MQRLPFFRKIDCNLRVQAYYIGRYLLYIEHMEGGKIRVISGADESGGLVAEGLEETAPLKVNVRHEPERQIMWITVNDRPPVPHNVGLLVSAPSQIRLGENDPFYYTSQPKFSGTITQIPR